MFESDEEEEKSGIHEGVCVECGANTEIDELDLCRECGFWDEARDSALGDTHN